MARYFQAPVLQPVDYGYQMPFQQIYGAMQLEQKKFDEGEKAVLDLYSFEKLNALHQDYAKRNELVQNRLNNVDALLYDENGNQRDMRYVMPDVKREARRRAKEEQAGGQWYQIDKNYKDAAKYVEELQKMHEKGDISRERRAFLEAHSLNELYQGIGDGSTGVYNSFRGLDAAKEVKDMEIAFNYAKDTSFQELQAAGLFDNQGNVIATEENLEKILKMPKFQAVLGGDYIQHGTVEFRTFDLLRRVTLNALKMDDELMSDISQEAYIKGLRTPELQQEYMDKKMDFLAFNAADKYASLKVHPQLIADWRRQEALRHKNALAQIDYEKTKEQEATHIDFGDGSTELDPKAVSETYVAAKNALSSAKELYQATFFEKDGTPKKLTPIQEAQKKQMEKDIKVKEQAAWQASEYRSTIYNKLLETEEGANKLATDVATEAIYALTGFKTPNQKILNSAFVYLKNIKYTTDGKFDPHKLAEAVRTGEVYKDKEFIKRLQSEANQSKYGGWNNMWAGETEKKNSADFIAGNYSSDNVEKKILAEAPKTKYTVNMTSEIATGANANSTQLGMINKDIEVALKTNHGSFYNMDGSTFEGLDATASKALGIKGGVVTEYQAAKNVNNHQADDGAYVFNVSAKVKLPNGTYKQVQFQVHTGSGTNTSKSIGVKLKEAGYDQIEAAPNRGSTDMAVNDLQTGARQIGTSEYAGSGLGRIQSMNVGDVRPISKAGSDRTQFYVKKVGVDQYVVAGAGANGKPDFGNTSSFLQDSRIWTQSRGKSGNFIFSDEGAIYETLGWETYLDEKNIYSNENYLDKYPVFK